LPVAVLNSSLIRELYFKESGMSILSYGNHLNWT